MLKNLFKKKTTIESRLHKAEIDIALLKTIAITPSERSLLDALRHREER